MDFAMVDFELRDDPATFELKLCELTSTMGRTETVAIHFTHPTVCLDPYLDTCLCARLLHQLH